MPVSKSPVLTLLGLGAAVKDLQLTLDAEISEFYSIGRSPENALVLGPVLRTDYGHLSRRHCTISYAEDLGAWYVEDCGSANGTAIVRAGTVERCAVTRSKSLPLQPGDKLELAGCEHFNFLVESTWAIANNPEVLSQTVPMLDARRDCLQIIDQGGVRGVASLAPGSSLQIAGGEISGSDNNRITLRGFADRLTLGSVESTGGQLRLHWHPKFEILWNGTRCKGSFQLSSGDLITFPAVAGVALIAYLPSRPAKATPLSSLVLSNTRITIGRDQANDVRLTHPSISRQHAVVQKIDQRWQVQNLTSSLACKVNDNPVSDTALLTVGDTLTLGALTWTVDSIPLGKSAHERVPVTLQCVEASLQINASGQSRTILHPLSFRVNRGELLGIIGPSASGKSTVLNLLAGRTAASSGEVLVNGRTLNRPANRSFVERRLRKFSGKRGSAGYVEQHDLIYPNLPTTDLLLRSGIQAGLSPAQSQTRADEVLELCQLSDVASRIVIDDGKPTIGTGKLKRICIAIALMQNSTSLLVDEPINPLDDGSKGEFLELFRSLAQRGTTVILALHDLHYLNYCHKILVLALGRMIYYGSPAHLGSYFGVQHVEAVISRLPRFADHPEDQDAAKREEALFRRDRFYEEFCSVEPHSSLE